jgi:hypothetical protein
MKNDFWFRIAVIALAAVPVALTILFILIK